MKSRILLEMIGTIVLSSFLILYIIYYNLYLMIPLLLVVLLNLLKARYLFCKKLNYNDRKDYCFNREIFALFSLYVFESADGQKYIDNGDYFSYTDDYSNIKLKYLKKGVELENNYFNTKNRIWMKLLILVATVCLIVESVMMFKNSSDNVIAVFYAVLIIFTTVILLSYFLRGMKITYKISSLMSVKTNGSNLQGINWFNMNGETLYVNYGKKTKLLDVSNNRYYLKFVENKFMEVVNNEI